MSLSEQNISYRFTRPFVWLLLASCCLMCFTWGVYGYYAIFAVILLFLYRANWLWMTSPILAKLIFAILVVDLITTANYCLTEGFVLNRSWFIQIALIPFLFCFSQLVVHHDLEHFQDTCLFFLKYVCLPLALFAFLFNWYLHPMGLSFLAQGIIQGDVYLFAHYAHLHMGLLKGHLPWLMPCLAIAAAPIISFRQARNYFLAIFAYAFVIGAKSTLLGLAAVFFVYGLRKNQARSILVVLLVVVCLGVFVLQFDYFNGILLHDGRYFAPILFSEGFWSRPLGVGFGNYSEAMQRGLFGDNPFDSYACGWIHQDMHSKYDMYVVAESDLLLLAVCFGWLTVLIIGFFVMRIFFEFLIHYHQKSIPQRVGFYLFTYLIAAGITQDFLNVQSSWVFYAFAFTLMFDPPALGHYPSVAQLAKRPFSGSLISQI